MNESVLSVSKLYKTFAKQQRAAVAGISFTLQRGEILGLLGPNGAGKTTTIQMLLGTLTPSSGSISYFNQDFFKNRSKSLQKVGFASTYSHMPEHITVSENLHIHGLLQGLSKKVIFERIDHYLHIFRLQEKRNSQFGSLSAGQKTRVLLAKAFLHNPEIVLLDEPTAALDPDVAEQIRAFILDEQKQRKLSVFFTSHNMHEISYMCDRVIVLKDGHLVANDTPHKLATAVSTSHVHLMFKEGFSPIAAYAQQQQLPYTTHENIFSITIDEQKIAQLLSDLATQKINYTHISIDKPSLEDYFLHVANQPVDKEAA